MMRPTKKGEELARRLGNHLVMAKTPEVMSHLSLICLHATAYKRMVKEQTLHGTLKAQSIKIAGIERRIRALCQELREMAGLWGAGLVPVFDAGAEGGRVRLCPSIVLSIDVPTERVR